MMRSATFEEVFKISNRFRRSLIPKQAEESFSRISSRSTSKTFSLIFFRILSEDSLLDRLSDIVEELEHFSFELPLALMISSRFF